MHRNTAALVALILFLVGLGAGWFGRRIWDDRAGGGTAPKRVLPTPVPLDVAPAWTFRPVSAEELCAPGGERLAAEALQPAKRGPVPVRLGDETLTMSPIDVFQRSGGGPVSMDQLLHPWNEPIADASGVKGYAAGFNSDAMAGGFLHTAYEFKSPAAAAAIGAQVFHSVICDSNAEPAEIEQQDGIAVASLTDTSGEMYAWWVHGDRLVTVSYFLLNERETDLQAALVVIEAAYRTG